MKKPFVSIIILNFNGIADTVKCLKSLYKTTYPNYEVLLVDNGSDNNEGSILAKRYHKKHNVILLDKNLGFTGGNNCALKEAVGKYIILLNNDTVIDPGWIEPMVEMLEKDKAIAVIQPKIHQINNRKYFDYAGAGGGFIDKYGYPFTRGRIFSTKEEDSGQYEKEGPIFWASGACCIFRKSVIKKTGYLFDPIYFNYMEEIDFCWRVWKAGYKVFYCPKSLIFHKGAASAGKDLFIKRYWEHKNNLILLYKNKSRKDFFETMRVRFFFEILNYLYYFMKGDIIYLKSLFKAHKDFIRLLITNKIHKNRGCTNNSSTLPIFPSSIILHHFILRKKYFSLLDWSPNGNISFLILNTKPSGGLKLIISQANDLISKGYNTNLYKIYGPDFSRKETKVKAKNIIWYITNPVRDNIIFTFWPTVYLYSLFKARNKYYLVMDSELFYKYKLLKILVRRSFKFPLKFITISAFLKKEIEKSNPETHPQIVNTNSVDYQHYIFHKNGKIDPDKKIRILSVVSNYEYYKGIDLLTKTVQELKKNKSNYH